MKKYLLAAVAVLALCGPALAFDCNKEGSDQIALAKSHMHNIVIGAQLDQSLRSHKLSAASDELLNRTVQWFDELIDEDNFLIENANKLHETCGYPVMQPTGMGIAAMAEDRDLAQAELRRRTGQQ